MGQIFLFQVFVLTNKRLLLRQIIGVGDFRQAILMLHVTVFGIAVTHYDGR